MPIARTLFQTLLIAGSLIASLGAAAQPVKLGAGTYYLAPKGKDAAPPVATGRTEAMMKRAAPTNQWYSTLMFNPEPEALFVQPLTVRTTKAGLEVALPSKTVVPTERKDVEIHYPHSDPVVISPVAFAVGAAKLANASDWSIDIAMGQGADDMTVTVAHGLPYAQVRISRGDVRLRLPAPAERLHAAADTRALAVQVKGKVYAMFGPTGVVWEQVSPTEWIGRLPAGKGYLSAAALPDDRAETLSLFARHAYAFLKDTRVDWRYDAVASQVVSGFTATTQMMEGADNGPLLGLYPHQWFRNASVADKLGPAFDTLRGKIRLLAAPRFEVTTAYNGFVPHWPGITAGPGLETLTDVLKADLRKRRELIPIKENKDNWRVSAYWQGKGLTRTTQLMAVAEQQGDLNGRDQLLGIAKERILFMADCADEGVLATGVYGGSEDVV